MFQTKKVQNRRNNNNNEMKRAQIYNIKEFEQMMPMGKKITYSSS